MNRSMSKIRHIQEANLKLENRLLKEDDVATDSVASVNSVGRQLSSQEMASLAKFFRALDADDFRLNPLSKHAKYSPLILTQNEINSLGKNPYNLYLREGVIQAGKPLAYSAFNYKTGKPYNLNQFADGFGLQKLAKGIYVDIDRPNYAPEQIPLVGNEDSIISKIKELFTYIHEQSFYSKS